MNMAQSILFKNARLIDSITDRPREGASILVKGERIAAVETGTIPEPASADIIDLKGQTVVPGLIDTYVHATFVDKECLPLFLAAGVTTARDVGGSWKRFYGSGPI
jgi:imidazolonepropionase-like amidohydrolase